MKFYLFCLLVSLVAAAANPADTDGGFKFFCNLVWLSSPHDTVQNGQHYKHDGHKATCKQTYTLPTGFSKEAAVEMCYEKTPFPVNRHFTEDSFEGNTITCHWESATKCEITAVLIGQTCYRSEPTCPDTWTTAKLSGSVLNWLSLYFDQPVLKFNSSSRNRALPDTVYHRGYIHRNEPDFKDPKGPLIAVLQRFPVNGVYAGQYVQLYDPLEPNIMTLCEKKAYGVPTTTTSGTVQPTGHMSKDPRPKETGTAATAYRKLCAKNNRWCMISYRNLFQPRLNGDLVDMKSFHEFCAKKCEGCFAASDFHYNEVKNSLPNGRYYVPVANQKKDIVASTDCQATATQKYANMFNQLRTDTVITGTDLSLYVNDYPSNRCSDSARRAVQFYKKDGQMGLMDAPIFDRLPIYCVTGDKPPAPAGGRCMKNAMKKGDKCQCKPGHHDALNERDVADYARSAGAVPGEVCLRDGKAGQSCTEEVELKYHYEAVMFLIDDSGSVDQYDDRAKGICAWCQVEKFMENAHTWVPNSLKIMICRYSSEDRCLGLAKIESAWTPNDYKMQAKAALSPRSYGYTHTYGSMAAFIKEWQYFRNHGDSKALMFVITDGLADDRSIRKQTIDDARDNNIYIKAVPVGSGVKDYFLEDVVNPAEDIIAIDNYGNLQDKLVANMKKDVCVYQNSHVNDAMQYQ